MQITFEIIYSQTTIASDVKFVESFIDNSQSTCFVDKKVINDSKFSRISHTNFLAHRPTGKRFDLDLDTYMATWEVVILAKTR